MIFDSKQEQNEFHGEQEVWLKTVLLIYSFGRARK